MPSDVGDLAPDIVLARLIALGRSLLDSDMKVASIGVAAPGPLDTTAGVIIKAETLPGWKNVPLAASLSRGFGGAATFVENDANLGAPGGIPAWRGTGR